MPRSRHPGLPRAFTGGKSVCPLCWKRPDKRDRTLNGYHIECAKAASDMIMDALHFKTGKLAEMLYAMRAQGTGNTVPPAPAQGRREST